MVWFISKGLGLQSGSQIVHNKSVLMVLNRYDETCMHGDFFFFFFFFFFSMKVYAKEQGIQDSIANGQYPNYKDTNRQNEKESNNKVKLKV